MSEQHPFVAVSDIVFPNLDHAREVLSKIGAELHMADEPKEEAILRVARDADALLVRVEAIGPGVCHEGYRSCFFRRMEDDGSEKVIEQRTFDAEHVYGQEKEQ